MTGTRGALCSKFSHPLQTEYIQDLLLALQQGYFSERRMAAKSSMTLTFSENG